MGLIQECFLQCSVKKDCHDFSCSDVYTTLLDKTESIETWVGPWTLENSSVVFSGTCELGMAKQSCSGKFTSIFVRMLQISHQVDNGGKSDDGILGSASEAFACVTFSWLIALTTYLHTLEFQIRIRHTENVKYSPKKALLKRKNSPKAKA